MIVSFDFDGTLDRKDIQEYCRYLIQSELDVEVIVCTFRLEFVERNPNWNDDLFRVCEELGIPKDKIIFTNMGEKSEYLPDNVLWHLDDDWSVMRDLQKNTKIIPISCFGSSGWREKCERLINNYEKMK